MDDQLQCFVSLVGKIVLENGNLAIERPAIRLRPVIRSILKSDAVAYILSIAEKVAFSSTGDSISLISVLSPVWTHLRNRLKDMNKDVFDFSEIHSISLDCLQAAVELCLNSTLTPKLAVVYRPWVSMGLCVDSFSVVNRRRRQEDRWFATSDLLSYAGAWTPDHKKFIEHTYPLSAVGVFDGHNGPEAAEHCSHLTPYLLSIALHKQLNTDAICITDILVDVFYELNQSVNKGRANGFWSSGTTATVCILCGDSIYTAWAGDSQAWLVYTNQSDDHLLEETSSGFVANPNSLTSTSPADFANHPTSPTSTTSVCLGTETDKVGSKDNAKCQISLNESSKLQAFDDLAIALTDTLHRPEVASEFVSVIRCGGMVTTEVCNDDDSPADICYFAGVNSRDILQPSLFRSTATNWLNIPPISDPGLAECRVGSVSCVSRAIGDDETIAGLSALPSVTVYQCRPKDSAKPLCLILASDGLWDADCCSGQEVAKRAQQWFRCNTNSDGQVRKGFAKDLAQLATDNGASDNVTCVVLWMNCWKLDDALKPKVSSSIGRKMRWPCGSRVTSMVDIYKSCGQIVGGEKERHSSSVESVHNSGIRYSSPPRYRNYAFRL